MGHILPNSLESGQSAFAASSPAGGNAAQDHEIPEWVELIAVMVH